MLEIIDGHCCTFRCHRPHVSFHLPILTLRWRSSRADATKPRDNMPTHVRTRTARSDPDRLLLSFAAGIREYALLLLDPDGRICRVTMVPNTLVATWLTK